MIAWNCDFCNKNGIAVSRAGILYCPHCKKSYGEQIDTEMQSHIDNEYKEAKCSGASSWHPADKLRGDETK